MSADFNAGGPMGQMQMCQTVREAFAKHFLGEPLRVFQAPGRVNLIGEHTDYNDGFVLPVAIDRQVVVAARSRTDRLVRLWSVQFEENSDFSLDHVERDFQVPWSNYVRGVASVLQQEGHILGGLDAVIAGNVPIGSGLSSSAALEVATATAFCALNDLPLSPVEVALLCQRAENEFIGMKCGIMDQFIAVLGQQDNALLIDCRTLAYERVRLPSDICIVVCDTMKRRGLVDSEYNARRRECEQGVALLREFLPAVRALRDVSSADLERFGSYLPPIVLKRCRHVVAENERVLQAVRSLSSGSAEAFGRLLSESHASLRNDYAVSCPELDRMVELAQQTGLCLGARMTGAGFGGCTVNWVPTANVGSFVDQVARGYRQAMGASPDVYVCRASAGAGEV